VKSIAREASAAGRLCSNGVLVSLHDVLERDFLLTVANMTKLEAPRRSHAHTLPQGRPWNSRQPIRKLLSPQQSKW